MTSPDPPYVVDLHAHFPMQLDPEGQDHRRSIKKARRHAEKLSDRIKFGMLEIADRLLNREHPTDGHAVTLDTLTRGNVGVALSVAYSPFSEIDVTSGYAAPPSDGYFKTLHDLFARVEEHVAADPRGKVVRNYAELLAARSEGKVALIHAVEGGLHVGGSDEAIARNVETLTRLGLGYVTVAHLFWRRVATNVPALPFLPDRVYRAIFAQDPVGLDARGKVLLREMIRRGVLIDLTHMSKQGMRETFALLDEMDPGKTIPVIASHIACSFGGFEYNLEEEWVARIAERGGVCGILYCDHYVRDRRGSPTKTFEESFALVEEQLEKLRAWGGDGVLALGSDLDGFIKPTLAGLSSAANHRDLATRLQDRVGPALAAKVCHENAMRVLRTGWMQPFA